MLKEKRLGIIGCGNMGEAILQGILAKKLIPKSRIIISELKKKRRSYIKKRYGIINESNINIVKKCNVLILAIKPQDFDKTMGVISPYLSPKKLLISILAGIKTEGIGGFTDIPLQIARIMPNMGALVGESISAISFGKTVNKENRGIVVRIFSCLGEVVEVNESQMDAITAVSGSGPAYFFYLVEALASSAVSMGLNKRVAGKLAIRTAIGSAKLLAYMGQNPQVLQDRIASKGGTTEAALKVFKQKGLQKIIKEAVLAATKRSRELSGG